MKTLRWEGRVWTRDKRLIWVQSISRPNRTKDGAIEWDGVLLDVTARHESADQRTETRRLLIDVIDFVPAVIGVKDLDLRYMLINKNWRWSWGATLTRQSASAGTILRCRGCRRKKAKNSTTTFGRASTRCWPAACPCSFTKSASRMTTARSQTKLSSKVPLFDQNGNVHALLTVTIDISDRKRAESALDQSRQLLQAVLDAVPATVSVKGLDLRYVLINRALATQLKCSPEEAVGRQLSDFLLRGAGAEDSLKRSQRVSALERHLLASGTAKLNHEETVRLGDGTFWTGLSSKVPLRDSEGRIYGLLTVVDRYQRSQAGGNRRCSKAGNCCRT